MHQANLRISEAAQKVLGLPDEKVFNNIRSTATHGRHAADGLHEAKSTAA